MTESITRIRGTGLPGPSPLGIMLPLLQIRPPYPRLFPSLLLSPPFTLFFFWTALLNLLSPPLFALRALPSSFFKLIHPSLVFPRASKTALVLSRSRSSSSLRLLSLLFPAPYPYPLAYYVIKITIICFETVSTAHQFE